MNEEEKAPPTEDNLISGILKDAQEEARRIVEEARAEAARKLEQAKAKALALIRESEAKALAQCGAIRKSAAQGIAVETKRISLRAKEETLAAIIVRVKKRLEAMIGTPAYRTVLSGWIAEAAMGLAGSELEVTSSAKELPLIDEALLREAERAVKDVSGRTVLLKKDETLLRDAQGVVLTSADRKTAFNNQVPTRLLRYQSEIRKVLYTELFKD